MSTEFRYEPSVDHWTVRVASFELVLWGRGCGSGVSAESVVQGRFEISCVTRAFSDRCRRMCLGGDVRCAAHAENRATTT